MVLLVSRVRVKDRRIEELIKKYSKEFARFGFKLESVVKQGDYITITYSKKRKVEELEIEYKLLGC